MPRKKGLLQKYINIRTIKSLMVSLPARSKFLRRALNINNELRNFLGTEHKLIYDYTLKYSLNLSVEERSFFNLPDELIFYKKIYLLNDITVNGRSGNPIDGDGYVISDMAYDGQKVHQNQVFSYPLTSIKGDDDTIYINCLGIKKGHKHFYHYYEDIISIITVIHKNIDKLSQQTNLRKIKILVRDDVSRLQKLFYDNLPKRFGEFEVNIQTIRPSEKIFCKNFIYTYIDTSFGRQFIDKEIIEFSRLVMSKFLSVDDQYSKIYLSRKDAKLRQLKDETALLGKITEHKVIVASDHPITEQIKIFHSAEDIIAIHGAGLVNLIFTKPGVKLLEIFPSNYNDQAFIVISKILGIDYNFIIGGKGDRSQSFFLGEDQLDKFKF